MSSALLRMHSAPLALYCLATSFSSNRPASFCAALIFSLFSPALLFLPAMRADAGSLWNPRRLQVLVVYGEGPNILGLALCMIALASLHWAVTRKTAPSALIAALVLAAVPATNWPSTVALAMGLFCYLAVSRRSSFGAACLGLRSSAAGVLFGKPFRVAIDDLVDIHKHKCY